MACEWYLNSENKDQKGNKTIHWGTSLKNGYSCAEELSMWWLYWTYLNGWVLSVPQQSGGDAGNKGSYFLGVESLSAIFVFMLSLSSHPARSLLKFLPVLHTTVQLLRKSEKEEILTWWGANSQGGIFFWANGLLHFSVRRVLPALSGFVTFSVFPPPNPLLCTLFKKSCCAA